jgi:hypothetical protein
MRALPFIFRLILLVGAGIAIAGVPTKAQTTSPKGTEPQAPGLGKLTGDDVKRADELARAIEAEIKDDCWDEAIAKTEELLALRTRDLGLEHFSISGRRDHSDGRTEVRSSDA